VANGGILAHMKRKHEWRIPPEQVTEIHRRAGSAPNLSREEVRALRQKAMEVRWSNPDAKKAQSERMKAVWQDPEYRAKREKDLADYAGRLSETSRQRWADPEFKERMSAKYRARWADPVARAQQSARTKERMADPEVRKRVGDGVRRAENTPEQREMRSAIMRAKWADPEWAAKMRALSADPARRKNLSEKAKAQWARMPPEQRLESMRTFRNRAKGGHYVSSLEASVSLVLNEIGAWYRLHQPEGPYVADIVVMGVPLVDIECDGIYWHSQEGRTEADAARDEWFAAAGYRVIRLTEPPTAASLRAMLIEG